MSVRAVFPPGANEIFVNGLHQWDYGQQLQIEAADLLSAMVEVHFACVGMSEAIVRTCAVDTGSRVTTTTIPDTCLEQSAPITAWVYQVGNNSGATIKKITMIVTPRPRPANSKDVENIEPSQYDELIGQITSLVGTLQAGSVTVRRAEIADTALTANTAGTATNAVKADTATKATTADVASRVDFASDDISKGTIEARLTSLGFKSGVFEIVGDFDPTKLVIEANEITKSGRFAIGTLRLRCSGGTYFKILIPNAFKPAKAFSFELNPSICKWANNNSISQRTVHADGVVGDFSATSSISLNPTIYFENIGWELADSVVYPTIKFTIDGITCYAERGMTWRDLYNSPYNSKQLSLRGPQDGYSEVWIEHEDKGQEYYISGEDWDNEIWEGAEYSRDGY